ncbi:MAG TPA: glycine cleavage T C-terminal barrel domain-containing protein [Gemmataceae bacterium]|jgi:folate-binding protein YgfZ|nr:glycine cleavage T C-terminal barrel domain-containing protein [Gemmataceae bacterium]
MNLHRAAGAVFATDASLPTHFGEPDAEYGAALAEAGLFDRSTAGKVEVSGKDAPSFLHNLSTNDINGLPLGGGCEAYLCDHRAKALAHLFVYHVLSAGRHAFWLDVTPDFNDKVVKHLDRHLISEAVELADNTESFAQFYLAGPKAKAVLEAALGERIPDLPEFMHMERTLGKSATCHIRRHDPIGVPGYDFVCRNEVAENVWRILKSAGATPAGEQVWETLRVENATPVYGIDINEDRFVMEVARATRAVSYAKGCYLGQEPIVMARDRTGFVNRAFLGVKVLDGGVLPAGTKLVRDAAEVGLITSSVQSPRLNAALAIGYIRRGHQDPGLRLDAVTPEGRQPVEVLPFPPVS